MNHPSDEIDNLTIAALQLLGTQPAGALDAPDHVVAAAKAVYTWRTIDEELAALTFDSSLDKELAGVRGTGTIRTLSFAVGSTIIEFDVSEGNDGAALLDGTVIGDPVRSIEVQSADGSLVAAVLLGDGRFEAAGVRFGNVRLIAALGSGAVAHIVKTEWVAV
jgi:hypothetical protein